MELSIEQQSHLLYKKNLFQEKKNLFSKDQYPNSLFVNYHGIPVRLHTASIELLNHLQDYFPKDWLVASDRAVDVYCSHCDDPQFENFAPYDVFEENGVVIQRDFVAEEDDEKVLSIFDHRFDLFADGFHNCMRWLLFRKLLPLQKLCLHSSVVIDDERAYVFLGHSGAGKSTITQLSKPRKHLGDDMNILSLTKEGLTIEAALLGQAYDVAAVKGQQYRIAGFFWLQQSEENQLIKRQPIEAAYYLCQSAPGLEMNNMSYQQLLHFVFEVGAKVPMYSLKFRKNCSLWEKIYAENL